MLPNALTAGEEDNNLKPFQMALITKPWPALLKMMVNALTELWENSAHGEGINLKDAIQMETPSTRIQPHFHRQIIATLQMIKLILLDKSIL